MNKGELMKQYLLILAIFTSPMAFAQGFQDFLTDDNPAAPKKEEPAKPAVTVDQQTQTQPVVNEPAKPVDPWAEVRCSAGKSTNLAFNASGMSGGDLIRKILNVDDPFGKKIAQSDPSAPYAHKFNGTSFELQNVGGRLNFHMWTLLTGNIDLPATLCLADDNKTVLAVLDATSLNREGKHTDFKVNLTPLVKDAINIAGVNEEGKMLSGSFTTR